MNDYADKIAERLLAADPFGREDIRELLADAARAGYALRDGVGA